MRDDVLEVARRGVERLLEALADPAVCLADQAAQLGERGLQVGALLLELLDVCHRLLVLARRERVDRAELLPAPGEALYARLELREPRLFQRLGERRGRRGVQAKSLHDPVQVGVPLRRGVARLLRADLRGCDGLACLAKPALELSLLAGAGAELGRGGLPALLVLGERLGGGVAPLDHGLVRLPEREHGTLRRPRRVGMRAGMVG